MHQLSASLLALGQPCSMAYYGDQCSVAINQVGKLVCKGQLTGAFVETYKHYQPMRCGQTALDPETLCIFPEAKAGLAFSWKHSPKAIWWLSVDNFKLTHPQLLNSSTLRKLFQDESILHLYQSNYAHDFLRQHGARTVQPLYDYTSSCYSEAKPEDYIPQKTVDFAFFPKKGKALAERFLARGAQELSRVTIEGMNQSQVKQALASSRLYLDFGHHPGKDRVPREAACMGNILFLHEKGAASFFEDHPLHSDYIFTSLDVHNGSLLSKVQQALSDPGLHFKRQAQYRHRVKMEREEFDWQVKGIFGAD